MYSVDRESPRQNRNTATCANTSLYRRKQADKYYIFNRPIISRSTLLERQTVTITLNRSFFVHDPLVFVLQKFRIG